MVSIVSHGKWIIYKVMRNVFIYALCPKEIGTCFKKREAFNAKQCIRSKMEPIQITRRMCSKEREHVKSKEEGILLSNVPRGEGNSK